MEQTKVVEYFENMLGKQRVITDSSVLQEYATDITGLRMV